jgi:hypothetical protein
LKKWNFEKLEKQPDFKHGHKNQKVAAAPGEVPKFSEILNHMKGRKNIMNENLKDRPPAFPPELINRRRPRGMVAADWYPVNGCST